MNEPALMYILESLKRLQGNLNGFARSKRPARAKLFPEILSIKLKCPQSCPPWPLGPDSCFEAIMTEEDLASCASLSRRLRAVRPSRMASS